MKTALRRGAIGLLVISLIAGGLIWRGASVLHQKLPTDMIVEENLPFLVADLDLLLGPHERIGDSYITWTESVEVAGRIVMQKRLFAVTGIGNAQAAAEGLIEGEEYVTTAGVHWDIGRVLLLNGIIYPDPTVYIYCGTYGLTFPDCSLEFGGS